MKSKIISMVLLTLIFSVIAVSAANFTISRTTLDFVEPQNTLTFSLNPFVANSNYIITTPSIYDNNNNLIPLTVSGNLNNISTSQLITVTTGIDYSLISFDKTYKGNLVIMNQDNPSDTMNISVNFEKSFCKYGENGTDLEISQIDINNNDGDDTEWGPFDEVTIEVEVTNEGDDRVRDVNVEIGLLDSKGKNIINTLENLNNKKINLGTINDGDDKTASFTFKVPSDFDEATYKLVVKAYSGNVGEKELCTAHSSDLSNTRYQTIDGVRETDEEKQIIVENIKILPEVAQCGETVQVSADVINIGDTDYEDQVKVNMYNKELGINLDKIIRKDFDQGDSSLVEFEFELPKNAKEKSYTFEFTTYYDYDEDDDYNVVSDTKFVNYDSPFKVEGNCAVVPTPTTNQNAQITSTELSEETPTAIAGKKLLITATVKNTGDVETTYTVSVTGNSEWADLVEITPQTLTIAPGASKTVNLVFNVDSKASGSKDFTIKLNYGGKSTEYNVRDIEVTSEQVEADAVMEHLKQNWFIYVIVLVNVVLIIAIIMVIRRMMRPRVPRM